MKFKRSTNAGEHGSAVVVVLILLFLMVALSTANNRALNHLKKELQVTEKQQTNRIAKVPIGSSK